MANGSIIYDDKSRRLADEIIAAEARHIAQRKQPERDCDCQEGMFPRSASTDRRRFLFAAGSAAGMLGSTAAMAQKAPPGAVEYDVPPDPTKVPGRAVAADGGYGTRSQFETEVRVRFPTPNEYTSWSLTPLDKMLGNLTASGLHFERHHGGIPTIDPANHMLFVHGMVDMPKKFTMADLKRFPTVTRKHFIECSGNGLTEWNKPTAKTVQGTHGLLSTSEWTGVQFATIAREVGLQDGATWVLAEGSDAAVMTRSIPMEKMLKDALLVYGQNGEAIRPEQGYPLRLLLPGYEGNTHIKWLRRLQISDKPFMTREETSKYTDLLANGKARQFSMEMEAKSVITFPSGDMKLPGPGFYNVTGLAWSGRGRVQSVDVSADGGQTWYPAQLNAAAESVCTVRFSYPWMWDGKPAILQSRCTDETGYIQPTLKQLIAIRGSNGPFGSIYHLNAIQSWAVDPTGMSPMSTRNIALKAGAIFIAVVAPSAAFAQSQTHYGFGTTADPQELAKFFSIPADGTGLPPGSGTPAAGAKVFADNCAACHGDKGQGNPAKGIGGDRLLGGRGTLASATPIKTVESYWPYSTTLFDYVKRAMPFSAPGSLTDNDVYAVVAYILSEANIIKPTDTMNATTLPKVAMPNRDGFIPDARPELELYR